MGATASFDVTAALLRVIGNLSLPGFIVLDNLGATDDQTSDAIMVGLRDPFAADTSASQTFDGSQDWAFAGQNLTQDEQGAIACVMWLSNGDSDGLQDLRDRAQDALDAIKVAVTGVDRLNVPGLLWSQLVVSGWEQSNSEGSALAVAFQVIYMARLT